MAIRLLSLKILQIEIIPKTTLRLVRFNMRLGTLRKILVFPILFLRFCAHEKPCRSCCEELRHSRNKGMPWLLKPVSDIECDALILKCEVQLQQLWCATLKVKCKITLKNCWIVVFAVLKSKTYRYFLSNSCNGFCNSNIALMTSTNGGILSASNINLRSSSW